MSSTDNILKSITNHQEKLTLLLLKFPKKTSFASEFHVQQVIICQYVSCVVQQRIFKITHTDRFCFKLTAVITRYVFVVVICRTVCINKPETIAELWAVCSLHQQTSNYYRTLGPYYGQFTSTNLKLLQNFGAM